MKRVILRPGELLCYQGPCVISTVLGSCVAVTIYDPIKKAAGMNHIQLPTCFGNDDPQSFKYARPAIVEMLKIFKNKFGSSKDDLVVNIFGGANINTAEDSVYGMVGSANIKEVKSILDSFKIPISNERTGGKTGMKVEINVQSGQIRFQSLRPSTALKEEQCVSQAPIVSKDSKEKRIHVLIVDDSKVIQKIITKVLSQFNDIVVVGTADGPMEAEKIRKEHRIDVMTLDLNMPQMDGVTYLKSYMALPKVPSVIVTDYNLKASGPVFDALEWGALDYLQKPSLHDLEDFGIELYKKIKMCSEYSLRGQREKETSNALSGSLIESYQTRLQLAPEQYFILIGSSTGGTEALKELLMKMPAKIPPILIVQHIPPVFSRAFAERLNQILPFKVKEASHGDRIEPGVVYIAPGGQHMKIKKMADIYKIQITEDPPVNRFRPSVDYLFASGQELVDKKIISIILTGMGDDGAREMLNLKRKGSITIAQDERSCVVYGMPKAAKERGAVDFELPLDKIAEKIVTIIAKKQFQKSGDFSPHEDDKNFAS